MQKGLLAKVGGLSGLGIILTTLISVAFVGALVYSKKDDLSANEKEVVQYATDLGLDKTLFEADFKSDKIRQRVDDQKADGSNRLNGSLATPSVFINGSKVELTSFEDLKAEIATAAESATAETPTLVEIFSDYNCSHCATLSPLSYQYAEEFGSKVNIVHKHLPFLKESSFMYALAAEAAREQGKFEEMDKKLFTEIMGTSYSE